MSESYKFLKSYDAVYLSDRKSRVTYYFGGFILLCVLILFLPWTQNIKANGDITTLRQEQRPQKINSPIPGRISQWKVKEGDFIKKGDTILILTEIELPT